MTALVTLLILLLFVVGLWLLIRRTSRPNETGMLQVPRSREPYPYELGVVYGSLKSRGIQVLLPVFLPNIIVDSHHNDEGGSSLVFDAFESQRLELEGDFYKDGRVYVPKGFERVALQLLTPDVMELLQAKSHVFDLEVIGQRLVLLCQDDPRDDDALRQELVSTATAVVRKWQGFLAHWNDKPYPDHTAFMLRGRLEPMEKLGRLHVRHSWVSLLTTIVALLIVLVLHLAGGQELGQLVWPILLACFIIVIKFHE